MAAGGFADIPGFVAANQAYYKAALQAASEVLGAANGR
jgi:hypothetical protein